ncbi:helix-turn-helix domain-containing protein [Caballeronia sordidicola]|uniref:Transcriptional regulator, LysR family n=1 Tax=Caballeronia sordidicola TaxID=196367 RepID=A0A242M2U2_CABSO|nr:LysR family transcriptional regulator [Caballeronia sordidicola]OTP65255.1 Transcriptional regulator, LysR family [Caballeronia sordidicola]
MLSSPWSRQAVFSAAARRIGDSQSSVSKAIGSLEKRLGVALLIRSTRSVTLTDRKRLATTILDGGLALG